MGRQHNLYIIARQENIIYYHWRGGYYMRTKSSLDGKRWKQDPAFAGSRKRAVEFGEAAKLAAEVYQRLPGELKKRGMIGRLTGLAHRGMMAGESREVVKRELLAVCGLAVKSKDEKGLRVACTAGPAWMQLRERSVMYTGNNENDLSRSGRLLLEKMRMGAVEVLSPPMDMEIQSG